MPRVACLDTLSESEDEIRPPVPKRQRRGPSTQPASASGDRLLHPILKRQRTVESETGSEWASGSGDRVLQPILKRQRTVESEVGSEPASGSGDRVLQPILNRQRSVESQAGSEPASGSGDRVLQPALKRQKTGTQAASGSTDRALTELTSSDAETVQPAPKARSQKKAKRRPTLQERRDNMASVQRLERMLRQPCRKRQHCGLRCFATFQEREDFERLVKFRSDWASMHKLDQDEVFESLRSIYKKTEHGNHDGDDGRELGPVKFFFLDRRVCKRAWTRLYGLGAARFKRLHDAVMAGKNNAPVDKRYISKPFSLKNETREIRADVTSFLQKLYESVAETMPDVRDSTQDEDDLPLLLRGHTEYDLAEDPYTTELNRQTQPQLSAAGAGLEKAGNKRFGQGKVKKTVTALAERSAEGEERFLPPGKMIHYWGQYKLQAGVQPPASFVTFWRVWLSLFPFMKFRTSPQDARNNISWKRICGPNIWTGSNIGKAGLCNLRSGHSHEDIDQAFGSCAAFLVKKAAKAESSDSFQQHLTNFLEELPRPHEKERAVVRISRVRDWKSFMAAAVPVSLKGIGGPGAPHEFLLERRVNTGAEQSPNFKTLTSDPTCQSVSQCQTNLTHRQS
ncbi:cofG [Symbiodinium sp. CCMP2592]|nr:cofG [Symbiodinium sp. CCMP2592]